MKEMIDTERLEQAAAWRVRLAESHDLQANAFSSWLAEDPRNREAWHCVQAPWGVLAEHATSPEVIRLRRAALVHAQNGIRSSFGWPRRFHRPAVLAAAAAAVAALGTLLLWQYQPDVYRTGLGERRVITLADGSQLTLDARSEVTVRYAADVRTLRLLKGQARFDVAHDSERPFTVNVDGHKVVATGTAFDVDLLGADLLVTLINGHVVVLPQSAPARAYSPVVTPSALQPQDLHHGAAGEARSVVPADWSRIELNPGEQLVMSSGAPPHVARVDLGRVTAWEHGEIEFKDEPLAAVIERMNRYGRRPIIADDPRVASLRISGVFHEGDIDGFVATLASYLPVQAQERPDGAVLLGYRASNSMSDGQLP
jgi:transmembrane sensor